MLTAEQKEWRRFGIGGSDARTIAFGNGNDWAALRAEKKDGFEPVFAAPQLLLMAMGHAIEPLCLDQVEAAGHPLAARDTQATYAADDFFRCTLDGLTVSGLPVQCKFHTGDKNIEQLVEYYWPQLQHEMLVTGQTQLIFGVIFGHYGRFELETVPLDQAFLDSYVVKAFEFRNYLVTGELPKGLEIKPPVNIVRGRDHVWSTNDNEVTQAAVDWIESREAADKFKNAADALKGLIPEDARSAKWVRNGVGVSVKVDKRGAKRISFVVEKAA
jgi:predicted phage-related endonuclease